MMSPSHKESNGNQALQAGQYKFPYHYIPLAQSRLYLSRHWPFASSYIAALNLVASQLGRVSSEFGSEWRHIDIGCGDGALVHYLAQQEGFSASQIAGVDIDKRAIQWAKLFNSGSDFFVGDMADLSGNYHSASLVEVLEHIRPDDLPSFMTSAASLLRSGGLLVVTVPSVEKPVAWKHFQHFSFDSIRSVIEPEFENVQIFGFERADLASRIIARLRVNPVARIDAPMLNRLSVRQLSRLSEAQRGCGRIFVTARRKA